MGFANKYIEQIAHHKESFIKQDPPNDLRIIVTIPCYKEDNIESALDSLFFCTPTQYSVEVLILVNYPSDKPHEYELHKNIYQRIQKWINTHSRQGIDYYVFFKVLPEKDAGVGLARKILMDEAILRYNYINQPEGIIVGYDADCNCDTNYLQSIERFFLQNSDITATSIYYEHPIEGSNHDSSIYKAILLYELYLRYYIEGLRFANYPFAFHTLGSAFAVRADAYIKQGGMNKRKAGEDFYFLNKIMLLGNYTEINHTKTIPSPRISDRVPFGTGAAISKILKDAHAYYFTYNPQVFLSLRNFLNHIEYLYTSDEIVKQFDTALVSFLNANQWDNVIIKARNNSSNPLTFRKRILQWFTGLKVLQFFKFAHETKYAKTPINKAIQNLFDYTNHKINTDYLPEMIELLRNKQNKQTYKINTDYKIPKFNK